MNIRNGTGTFSLCVGPPILEYYPEPEASKWIYKVLRNKMKIMFYSGDNDGALPTYGSKRWIETLNWKRTADTE